MKKTLTDSALTASSHSPPPPRHTSRESLPACESLMACKSLTAHLPPPPRTSRESLLALRPCVCQKFLGFRLFQKNSKTYKMHTCKKHTQNCPRTLRGRDKWLFVFWPYLTNLDSIGAPLALLGVPLALLGVP